LSFDVLIPARLASTRLPGKPLADIAGLPMIVRVARRAAQSAARSVTVAADDPSIVAACAANDVAAVLTGTHHASGSDRLAEAARLLGFAGSAIVVNVQGDEPMIDPALIDACADLLERRSDCAMSTAAHPIASAADFANPNIVKVVLDAGGAALYSRAPRCPGRATAAAPSIRGLRPSGRFATSASMPIGPSSCSAIRCSRPARSRPSSSSSSCACSGTASGSPSTSATARRASASTPRPISRRRGPCSRRMLARVLPERAITGSRRIDAYDGCLLARPPTRSRRT
jgi:CMP-2-keto-3-deoxyoctulosonic acid synthetase